jgi:hypothetical protein
MSKNNQILIRSISGYQTGPAEGAHKGYGENALVTRIGHINIVHLDHPNDEIIQKRIEEVIAEEISGDAYEDDCPLCRSLRNKPYDIVYYGKDRPKASIAKNQR